jgi:hypothetical protein
MRKTVFSISLSLLISALMGSDISFPENRGLRTIRVVSKQGKRIDLYKDYHALVVGISNYEQWPKLPNAVNDAREIAAKLKGLGFKVKLVLDPTYREMKTALSKMVYGMGREENRAVLFYYAGHGETETLADRTKMGYIIPKDCPLLDRDPIGFANHAVSMRDIETASLRIRSRHVMMLFDSCFSGALFALVRAVPHDITEKSTLPVRQYITAGREDEQVPDKSMFKRCFLIGLEGDADLTGDGYITGSELGMYLSDKVVNYTHRRQHPQYGKINNPDLDRGDFIFVPLRERRKGKDEAIEAREEKSSIAEERARLEAERKRLADEKRRLEEERKLVEERRRLVRQQAEVEAERKRMKEAKRRLSQTEAVPKEKTKSGAEKKEIQQGPESPGAGQRKPKKDMRQTASIPETVKETPYHMREKSRVPLESKPGLYVNQDLGFSVHHPESWVITNRGVYSADCSYETSLPNVSVYVVEKPKSIDLEDFPEFLLGQTKIKFPDSSRHEISGKGKIILEDGTPAVEYDMKWVWGDGQTKLITTYVVAYRHDKCVYVTSSNYMPLLFTYLVVQKLKAITHSLKFY